MTAPKRLPGEVWRGASDGAGGSLVVCIHDGVPLVWRATDDEKGYTGSKDPACWYALSAWGLAMMAERDAAREEVAAIFLSLANVNADLMLARAEVARLRGLPPSLPGYGHDEEPAEDRVERERQWAGAERPGTPITKPREP